VAVFPVKDLRLLLNGLLLCVPAAVLVVLGFVFLSEKVPQIIKNERQRVIAGYRLVAEDLRDGSLPANAIFEEAVHRPKRARKMKPGRWDFEPAGNGRYLVWYAVGDKSTATLTKEIEEFDFATLFYSVGAVFMALFVAMTVFGVRYFWKLAKERDDFLAATAHDLMTPLVGMRYAVGSEDTDAKWLTERMIRIVENLKDFLKLGGKRRAPRAEAFDLVEAYEKAYAVLRDDYRDLFDGEDIALEFAGGVRRPIPVMADETMTVQIIWNLLGNDLKYAAPYGRVKVRFSAAGGNVRLEVADEGQGMTPRQMSRAFDRYYRASTVLETGKGGFGIGLCSAREFARLMKGDLTVGRNVPRGCIFTLTLPRGARSGEIG
jgi:signal transduction histidine kinase